MKLKRSLYHILIENNALVRSQYQSYIQERDGQSLLASVKEVIRLYSRHVVFRRYHRKKYSRLKYPETGRYRYPDIQALLAEAGKADVVSFDVFDTLLLSVFDEPQDLFIFLGNLFGIADFRNLRKRAEQEARKQCAEKNAEINIRDIYAILEQWCGIPCEEGVEKELFLEQQFCFANPFLKEAFEQLKGAGKRIIITSDMYLTAKMLDQLLLHCGITGYEKIYVSCDCQRSKRSGRLQKYVSNQIGKQFTYFHIGDDRMADIRQSERAGWQTAYCRKVREYGLEYRPSGMSRLLGSVYKGLVHTWYYAGNEKRTIFYEFGFTCGGILALGFCRWLNRLAKAEQADKFFFVARDGDILSKVYDKYLKTIDYEYVPFSRSASEQLIFGHFTEEYIRHAVWSQLPASGSSVLAQLLDRCGIDAHAFSADELCLSVDRETVRRLIYQHKPEIQKQFQCAADSAKKYFTKLAGKSCKICVVDIGWRGTSVQYLKYLLEKQYRLDVQVTGALLGAGIEPYAEGLLAQGTIQAYLFSQADHRKRAEHICFSKEHRWCMELLFSSVQPTLLKYGADEKGEIRFVYQKENELREKIMQIQNGIMDFADWYFKRMGAYAHSIEISPEDAAAPVLAFLQNKACVTELAAGCTERGDALRHGFACAQTERKTGK